MYVFKNLKGSGVSHFEDIKTNSSTQVLRIAFCLNKRDAFYIGISFYEESLPTQSSPGHSNSVGKTQENPVKGLINI